MLAGRSGRILAVGDPRQAIMGFAGADCDSYHLLLQKHERIEMVIKGKIKTLKGTDSPQNLAEELMAVL